MSKAIFHEKRLETIRKGLTPEEEAILLMIYQGRLMTQAHVNQMGWMTSIESLTTQQLVRLETLTNHQGMTTPVFFLTQDGAGIAYQSLELPKNERNEKDSIVKRYRFKASELKPTKIDQQQRLITLNQVVEGLREQLQDQPYIRLTYQDGIFHKLWLKEKEHYLYQRIPCDGILTLNEYEIHLHETQERLTKILHMVKKHYLPWVQSPAFTYLERPVWVVFLVETKKEAAFYRDKITSLLGQYTSHLFNVLVITPQQLQQFFKHKLIPELTQPYAFQNQMRKKINDPQVVFGTIKPETQQRLKGSYQGAISYQQQVAFILDCRYKDVHSEYTLRSHEDNHLILRQPIWLLVWDNDKISREEVSNNQRQLIHKVSVEKLKTKEWIKTIFKSKNV